MKDVLAKVVKMLGSEDAELQCAAARVLGEVGETDAEVLKALHDALDSPNHLVASYALDAIASGAGAASQNVMGTAVFWGMLVATFLGVFLIPGNFAFVEGLGRGKKREPAERPDPTMVAAPERAH